jgi:threonine dehydrogenase-like Zn-dependent dehydrogenase
MRAILMYGAGDVRVENVPDPVLREPTDAIVRVVWTSICGSDLHPYHNMPASEHGTPMGHEFLGVVEDLGAEVTGLKQGDLVVASFAFQDNTCEFCREGVQTSCRHGGFFNTAQAEAIQVPQAAGTLVKLPVGEDSALLSLLTLADVYGTGYHAAKRANVNPRTTVTVIGDGAVGLLAVLSAMQLGAERIILMGRHKERTDLGIEYGATEVVAERGEEGIAKVRELTGGDGPNLTLTGGPAPVHAYIDQLLPDVLDGTVDPGKIFDRTVSLDEVPDGFRAMDHREAIKVLIRP